MLVPVTFRVSEKDRKDLAEQASAAGLSVSEYIRRRALGHPVMARADAAIIRELRRQGGLIKRFALSGYISSKEAVEAFQSIKKLVERVANDLQKNP
jgi:hypothetical protein